MKRIWLSKTGQAKEPQGDEGSHYGMANAMFRAQDPGWRGNTDDAYMAMEALGWVRVVLFSGRVYGEQYLDGLRTPFVNLTRAQREWFEDRVLEGRKLYWNDVIFEKSREGRGGLVPALVCRLLEQE